MVPFRLALALALSGCAAQLEEIKADADLSAEAQDTYVYGLVATDRFTSLNSLEFKNPDDGKRYVYRASGFTAGTDPDNVLFHIRMRPGKWKLIAMGFTQNGLPTAPGRVKDGMFQAAEGKGNFLGRFRVECASRGSYSEWPYSMAQIKIRNSGGKAGVDSLMARKFTGFDVRNTVAALPR